MIFCPQPKKKFEAGNTQGRIVQSGIHSLRFGTFDAASKCGRGRWRQGGEANVGEVQNLHRTTKSSRQGLSSKFALDLHGHSREGALCWLDESLELWVDAAMKGSYPFLVQVTIVCGCGNQILEEAVEGWIRATRNVGKAPNRALR